VEQVEIVKIDASFIGSVERSADALRRFDAIVALASRFVDCIVVEGIENAGDLSLACGAGIEWMQGYYFGRPSCKIIPCHIQENKHSEFMEEY
jgi:EAL domain-containing protein (putative c-di-GMP-specific phosphodiesterase class I)